MKLFGKIGNICLISFLSFGLIENIESQIPEDNLVKIEWLRTTLGNRLTLDYMKTDSYLNRWLKAAWFDQEKALKVLGKTLAWRKNYGADYLPFEDFGHLAQDIPIDFDSARDLAGKPVVATEVGKTWDVRRTMREGKSDEFVRRLMFTEEKAAQMSYNLTGDPAATLIFNLKGFTLLKHGCIACMASYIEIVRMHELHYPFNFDRIVYVNAPAIFGPIFKQWLPLMTQATWQSLKVFGNDETRWTDYLLETISQSELSKIFSPKV